MTESNSNFEKNEWSPDTLVRVLQERAGISREKTAIIYLKDGEDEEVTTTYAELDKRARQIAARLQVNSNMGERALLLYPPGLEYIAAFFGCLYAGIIAVPAYPPRLNRPVPRIKAILTDSGAQIALTTPDIFQSMEKRFEHDPELQKLDWVTTQNLAPGIERDWKNPEVKADQTAFLQYTSGSTSTPKGVILSHENLISNLRQISTGFDVNGDDVVVSWLPSYHDMGLIGSILGSIYSGVKLILIAPLDFLQRPFRWLAAMTKYEATVSGGPNFAYDFCVEKIKSEQIEMLDLTHWRLAFSGAEPVRMKTMERFEETFSSSGFRMESFYPCYGLAEGTLFVTGGLASAAPVSMSVSRLDLERDQISEVSADSQDSQVLVGCGYPRLNQKIQIVDPDTQTLCKKDQIGEIWIQGKSVAQGYWERSEENSETFSARVKEGPKGDYLRSGDLGFIRDGELFITGRLKDLIIIRGSNHYPQDIELTVEECHEALQTAGAGAFSVDISGEERLVVVQEVDRRHRRADLDPVINTIRQAIAENHDLQVYAVVIIKPFTIPKTSSGKIQRHACKKKYLEGSLDVISKWQAQL